MSNAQELNLSLTSETTFKDLGLPEAILNALDKMNFHKPTEVQALTIPYALQGRDILGSARTGTGKTLAFGLPLVSYLMENPTAISLILVPTRELAQQVSASIAPLLSLKSNIKIATLIGGEPYPRQFAQLRANPRIIVGTPGRVMDHMSRRSFRIDAVKFFILDETDRMFDMGFSIQLEEIMHGLPKERQTLMFSATFPPKIERLATTHLTNPKKVFVDAPSTISKQLKEETRQVKESDKYTQLCLELEAREGTIIIFVKTKMGAEDLADDLRENSHNALAIHGDLKQEKRERLIQNFRRGKCRIMVATDVAARGLDIPHIQHVINYDIPHCPEDYIHRIGRTARAGAEGNALNFVSSQDDKKWKAILKIIDPNFVEEKSRDRNGGDRGFGGGKPRSGRSFGGSSSSGFSRGGSFGERRAPRAEGSSFGGGSSFGERRAPRGEGSSFGVSSRGTGAPNADKFGGRRGGSYGSSDKDSSPFYKKRKFDKPN